VPKRLTVWTISKDALDSGFQSRVTHHWQTLRDYKVRRRKRATYSVVFLPARLLFVSSASLPKATALVKQTSLAQLIS
jgi:hypothetical protein